MKTAIRMEYLHTISSSLLWEEKKKKNLAPTRDKQHPQNKGRSQSKRVKNIQRRGSEHDGFSMD